MFWNFHISHIIIRCVQFLTIKMVYFLNILINNWSIFKKHSKWCCDIENPLSKLYSDWLNYNGSRMWRFLPKLHWVQMFLNALLLHEAHVTSCFPRHSYLLCNCQQIWISLSVCSELWQTDFLLCRRDTVRYGNVAVTESVARDHRTWLP